MSRGTPDHTWRAVLHTSEIQRCPDLPRSLTTPPLCLPQGLCFNGSAFILYLSAAVVDASSVSPERDSHNFNSWAASSVSERALSPAPPPLLHGQGHGLLLPVGLGAQEEGQVICRGRKASPALVTLRQLACWCESIRNYWGLLMA